MAEQPDGTVIEEKTSVDYTPGSDALGRVGKAVDKALTGMKRRNVAQLKCTRIMHMLTKHQKMPH